MELIQQYVGIFHIILIILALLTIGCLIRAVMGPTIADRLVAVNMMGTIVMTIIAVLALLMDEDYLVDICLIYAMISFLAVVVLTKVYTGVYMEHKARLESKEHREIQETQEFQVNQRTQANQENHADQVNKTYKADQEYKGQAHWESNAQRESSTLRTSTAYWEYDSLEETESKEQKYDI